MAERTQTLLEKLLAVDDLSLSTTEVNVLLPIIREHAAEVARAYVKGNFPKSVHADYVGMLIAEQLEKME